MQNLQPARPVAANIACFSAMAFWAVGFPAGEILLETWGTVTLIVVRLILGVICLALFWIFAEGFAAVLNAPWRKSIAVGAGGFGLGTVLLLYGQKLSDPVTPAIVAAMMPIAGAILEVALDGRKLRHNLILGITLAIAGGLLATGAQLSQGTFGLGAAICLLSVAVFAWGTRATTTQLRDLSPIGQSTATMIGALCFNIIVFAAFQAIGLKEVEFGSLAGNNLFHLLNFAIVSLAIAQFLWIWGGRKARHPAHFLPYEHYTVLRNGIRPALLRWELELEPGGGRRPCRRRRDNRPGISAQIHPARENSPYNSDRYSLLLGPLPNPI